MGLRRKTRANYRIKQHLVYSDTSIERFVRDVLDELQIQHQEGREILAYDGTMSWTFRPDILIPSKPLETIVEVLGPYHSTARQVRKTLWRSVAIARERRLILVPFEICTNRFRSYLKSELVKALISSERIVRILA